MIKEKLMKNKVFVLGATGFQGRAITNELLKNNYEVVTVKKKKEDSLNHLTIVEGSLEDKKGLSGGMTDVSCAVYTFPLIFDIELAKEYTLNFIAAAKEQNVPLIVWNTGFDLPAKEVNMVSLDMKVKIKELFDASGLKVITLVPDIYIDNISAPWSIPVIQNNSIIPYPVKQGQKMPWISHFDLARYVVSAIQKPELSGRILFIGGLLVTGDEIAKAVSEELGKTINYVAIEPNYFEEQIAPAFGTLAAKEISNLYRYMDENYVKLISKDYQKVQDVLGVKPQTLAEWAKSIQWG